jgi:hypothetical protein
MSTRNERLEQFFGGYFHQDWDIEGAASWRDVIKQYAMTVPRPQVLAIRNDLMDWLNETANHNNENLPPAFGCDYDPRSEGLTERQWVSQIVAEFDRLLQN